MTIDRKKLIELLTDKTDLAREDVEAQLDQLIERIIDAADRGKALEIKEFGLFFFDQDGELKFEPSEELSTEISFKYAGMKPVELKPERNTAIPRDDDQISNIVGDDVIVVPKTDQKSSTEKSKPTPKPKSEPSSKPIIKKTPRKKKDRSAVWAILAFISVLIFGSILYFNRPMNTISDESITVNEPVQQDIEMTDLPESDLDPENFEENSDESGEESEIEVQISDEVQIPNEEQMNESEVSTQGELYGLTGNLIEEANDGYSIVVHSFYNEFRASQVADNLSTEGYRTQVTSRTVGGIEVWRVSLGQFESIPDAQEVADSLPEPYNENNFIQRIQQQ
jgi:ribosomal protein L6P/L9E